MPSESNKIYTKKENRIWHSPKKGIRENFFGALVSGNRNIDPVCKQCSYDFRTIFEATLKRKKALNESKNESEKQRILECATHAGGSRLTFTWSLLPLSRRVISGGRATFILLNSLLTMQPFIGLNNKADCTLPCYEAVDVCCCHVSILNFKYETHLSWILQIFSVLLIFAN